MVTVVWLDKRDLPGAMVVELKRLSRAQKAMGRQHPSGVLSRWR
jgi:hypothetical protein